MDLSETDGRKDSHHSVLDDEQTRKKEDDGAASSVADNCQRGLVQTIEEVKVKLWAGGIGRWRSDSGEFRRRLRGRIELEAMSLYLWTIFTASLSTRLACTYWWCPRATTVRGMGGYRLFHGRQAGSRAAAARLPALLPFPSLFFIQKLRFQIPNPHKIPFKLYQLL